MTDDLAAFARSRFRFAGGRWTEKVPYFQAVDYFGGRMEATGRPVVSFCHYDYLDLMRDPRPLAAAEAALRRYGTGAGASRLVGGERLVHEELENALARFVGTEAAVVLVSGYLTNVSLVGHVLGSQDLILCDELSHSSMFAGTQGSKARTLIFPHNDLDALDALLAEHRRHHKHCLVMVESLYSMDGDIIDLPRIIELKKKHNVWLMVDEAHSIGMMGARGRGICEHFGVDPAEIDLIVGTLSKAFISCGGFIAGRADVMRLLKYTLPGVVFSVATPPASAAASLEALRILEAEPERVHRAQANGEYFAAKARAQGVDIGDAVGRGILPVLFETSEETVAASEALMAAGIFVSPIIKASVLTQKPRLRFFVTAAHTPAQIERAVSVIATAELAAAE